MQKISSSICSFFRYCQFWNLISRLATHIHFFTMPIPEIFNHLLICMNWCQHAKNKLIPSVHSWDTVKFRVHWPDCPHPFFTIPNHKNSNQLLSLSICINMKRWGYFTDLYKRNSWFKYPSIWFAEIISVYISQTRFFSI